MKKYFVYSPDEGTETFDSEEERDKEIERLLSDRHEFVETDSFILTGIVTKEYVVSPIDESTLKDEEDLFEFHELEASGVIPSFIEEITYE